MFGELKREVYEANILLPKLNLVTLTWGNVSGLDQEHGVFAIKPSGVSYDEMTYEDMVLVDLDGHVIEGDKKPSSDTATHLELYKNFPDIGGIVHTHSSYATSWAQAGRDLPCYGTTHADAFYGPVPCTRPLTEEELIDYEQSTGAVIVETFEDRLIDYKAVPAVLCMNHGPFTWGSTPMDAVHNAITLEECAKMALHTELINPNALLAPQHLLKKHFMRKHGPNAYYGQR